jgi:hypothetical protein
MPYFGGLHRTAAVQVRQCRLVFSSVRVDWLDPGRNIGRLSHKLSACNAV